MKDNLNREIDYLRVSVTDRCNLRCVYCMPAHGVKTIPHSEIFTYEEILRVCRVGTLLGLKKIKLTGGEPLVRRGIPALVGEIKALDGIEQVTMTSNGILLGDMAGALAHGGLDGVNISLDTTDPEEFSRLTRGGDVKTVLSAVDAALDAGLRVKINCVPARRLGKAQILSVAELARERPIHVRFIELMPMGLGNPGDGVPIHEVKLVLEQALGTLTPYAGVCGNGPASYASAAGFAGKLGFIGAVSHGFCGACNRMRLTATGFLKPCLHDDRGVDLRGLLRGGASDEMLLEEMRRATLEKPVGHRFQSGESGHVEQQFMSQIGG